MKFTKQSWQFAALIFVILAIVIWAAGASGAPIGAVLQKMLLSPFQSPAAASKALERFTPLLLAGIAVFWALRAGLFNIGVEGQYMVGGLAAAVVALKIPGPAGILAALVAGTLVGAAWAFPPAWLKAYKGAHEVIGTIMMNNIAAIVCSALIAGPLLPEGANFPATKTLEPSSRIGTLFANGPLLVSWAVPLALGSLWFFTIWFKKSIAGYELSAVGMNPTAAAFAGVNSKKVRLQSLVASGAISGLAGALQLMAHNWSFNSGFSAGTGYDALGVALLAGTAPLALIPSALLFAILNVGATQVQFLNVPKGLTTLILAVLIAAFAAARMYRRGSQHV